MGSASGLTGNDYDRIVDLAVAALHERDPERLWPLVSAQLLRALGGDVLIHKPEEWAADQGALWVRTPDGPGAQLDAHARGVLRRGYPFADHYLATHERVPLTAAQLGGRGGRSAAGWSGSETAHLVRGLFGAEHVLGLPLPGSDSPVTGFLVYRAGGDFTDAQLACAARLQPLLRGVVRQREVLRCWRASAPAAYLAAEAEERAAAHGLTPRETAVLTLLAEARTAVAIGRRLGIATRTVHKHVQNLYRKLGTSDRMATVLRAQAHGLLPPRAE